MHTECATLTQKNTFGVPELLELEPRNNCLSRRTRFDTILSEKTIHFATDCFAVRLVRQ